METPLRLPRSAVRNCFNWPKKLGCDGLCILPIHMPLWVRLFPTFRAKLGRWPR
ncbi:unnamed protein product [Cladocopium goreaui]|uniref:Uncharacterized protein n=1 Tax=Cladocopium goreaui TaxID=2562237 RepID=A0A9P1D601_9DINO|nr:unnamed protein product [Cladocopium goreaui]